MKMKQTFIAGTALLSAVAGFTAPAAQAEVAATVGASNMYYWRGLDLGGGAALSADLNYSESGFIAGIWTSSGDSADVDGLGGTEYDLYLGYSGSAGDFTYGISAVSYNYPTLGDKAVEPGDYVEIIPTLGYGPFKLTYYDAVAADHAPLGDKDYSYVTAELNFAKFAIKYGQHMTDAPAPDNGMDGVSHLDVTYKYNTKLSFTLGKVIDDNDGFVDDKVNFIVNLSLPIE